MLVSPRWNCVAIVLMCLLALAGERAPAKASETLPVGVAAVDITPDEPLRMYGYAARTQESEGIAGRLMAKALALGGDDDEGPNVLLTVDLGAVPPALQAQLLDRLQRRVPLAPERFVLANSHTHAGPNLQRMDTLAGEQRERMRGYAEGLLDKLEGVVLEALAARRPGRLAWAQGSVGFAANRRVVTDGKWTGFGAVPEGAVDHRLPVLRVAEADGRLLAVVVNYACHCTTLRGNFAQIHGDWAAEAQAFIEADHPGATALITIGCGADIDPHPHGTVELCRQHGRAIADEVRRLLAGPLRPVSPQLAARATTIRVPYHSPPSVEELKAAADRSYALQRLARQLERDEPLPEYESFHMSVWSFGDDLAMLFFSDEVVVDYALRLQRDFDGSRLWITAYANKVSRYIISERLLDEGGYEVRNSLSTAVTFGRPETLQPSMESRVVAAVGELLPEPFDSPGDPQPPLPELFGLPALGQAPLEVHRTLAYEEHAQFTYAVAEGAAGNAKVTRRSLSFPSGAYLVDDLLDLPRSEEPVAYRIPAPAAEQVAPWRSYLVDDDARLLPPDATLPVGPERGDAEPEEPVEGEESRIRRRVIHLLQRTADGAPAELPTVEMRVENDRLQVEVTTERQQVHLVLPPVDVGAGQIAVTAADARELLPPRLLPSGILPWGEAGRNRLARWDSAYREGRRPGWDIGRPASQLVQAVEDGTLQPGRIVELGCGMGHDAIYLAQQGFDVTALDIAPTALARAQERAEEAGVQVRWLLADVLRPPDLPPFDYVYDRGCYHGARRQNAAAYVRTVTKLSRPDTRLLILAGSDRDSRSGGPPRVTEQEIRGDFAEPFEIVELREIQFDTRDAPAQGAAAWYLLLERKDKP